MNVVRNLHESVGRVARTLYRDIGTPLALRCSLLFEAGEWEQLLRTQVDPKHYHDSESYFLDAAAAALLRKVEVDIEGLDLESDAREKFFAIERANTLTNARLSKFIGNQGPFGAEDIKMCEFFSSIRADLDAMLGPLPEDLSMRFGPGATYSDRGTLTTVPDKISSRPSVTQSAVCLLPLWNRTAWSRCVTRKLVSSHEIVPGNRFTTAPKDGLRRRGICIEPAINGAYQLAVGQEIRPRLKRGFGIDLRVAQDIHRRLACEGSRDGSIATIDSTDASDMIAYVVPRLMLPTRWFDVMDSLRSPKTLVDGKWHVLSKFSSMGNGFTFELETLLFAAICRFWGRELGIELVTGRNFGVFGDDIIVPVALYQPVINTLKFLGMIPNERKSFSSGPFRESCGGDYFNGVAVRPYFLKEQPSEPQHYIAIANGLRRNWRQAANLDNNREAYFARARHRTLDHIPSDLRRLRGPDVLGDLVINDSDRPWITRPHPEDPQQTQIKVVKPYTAKLGWEHWSPEVVLASALYGCDASGVVPRGDPEGYRKAWVPLLEAPPEVTASP